jgi:shikimate kinase
MKMLSKPVILIGFKHVGKSVIGDALADHLNQPFIDCDQQIEIRYEKETKHKKNCRDILLTQGEAFFREIETRVLSSILQHKPYIIAAGGGTPLLMKNSLVIHITALPGIVFERILVNGRPPFFNPREPLFLSFQRLWKERYPIYEKVKNYAVKNNRTTLDAVNNIIEIIDKERLLS